jgi:isoleucyl-tRNA synthetase
MVISTGLFNKPAFKNLIVNGLVLAGDGKKMSKRLKNYPDPSIVVGKYGADALRLYLINSPVVRAEPLKFQEAGVFECVKSVFLPWFHAYRFLVENIQRYEKENNTVFQVDLKAQKAMNVMDLWILSSFQSLIKFVHQEMAAYRLYTVVPRLLLFIEGLTNWYVRMNRSRLKGKFGQEDSYLALSTLFQVLFQLCKLMAPFTPFFVDFIYQNLKRVLPKDQQVDCVHYLMIPQEDAAQTNTTIETSVARMQSVIELGRTARDKRKLTMKRPLKNVLVVHKDPAYLADVKGLEQYVREELNVRTVDFSSEVDKFILLKATPNRKALGGRFGKTSGEFGKAITEWTHAQVLQFQTQGFLDHKGEKLTAAEVDVSMNFQGDATKMEAEGNNDVLVIINVEEDAALIAESLAREVTRRIQQLRKSAGLVPTDDVEVFFAPTEKGRSGGLVKAIESQKEFIREILGRQLHPDSARPPYATVLSKGELELEGEEPVTFVITRLFVSFSDAHIAHLGLSPQVVATAKQYLSQKNWKSLHSQVQGSSAHVPMKIEGKTVTFTFGKHFFFYVKDALEAK